MLVWSLLSISVYHYYSVSMERDSIVHQKHPITIECIVMFLLLPIGGWLADAYFGRYKVIHYGMWTMWLGSVLSTLSLVIAMVSTLYDRHGDPWISVFSKAVMGAGLGAFQANIIQFGIDQLSEVSSTDITHFVTWYSGMLFAGGIILFFIGNCTTEYARILVVNVCLTLALCLNFLFSHLLVKEQANDNPLPLIWKILQYSIKHKSQWQRILSLPKHRMLSRFNVAKQIYGGPFTSEQVEDVKTFFRVITIIATCVLACSGVVNVGYARVQLMTHLQNWPLRNDTSLASCYIKQSLTYSDYICVVTVLLFYKNIVQPLLYNVIPRVNITMRFLLSIFLFFIAILGLLGIELAAYFHHTKIHCVYQGIEGIPNTGNQVVYPVKYHWIIIPGIAYGLFMFLSILSVIEFVCAQAPFNMKGLMLGTVYILIGFCSLIQTAISTPFLYKPQLAWEKAPLTCGIWYFMLQGAIVIVGFVVAVVMIKQYKLRERNSVLLQQS